MTNLTAVLKNVQQEQSRLSAQLGRINRALALLNTKVNTMAGRRKRSLSASAVARIRAAQKARWAKWRKANKSGS